jgi:K+-sensing histidine kinase KdpD
MGVKVGLGVKSEIAVVFEVKTLRRGALLAVSSAPEFFSAQDLRFLESIASWVGIVIHRAELIERLKQEAREQGRRLASEELLTVMAQDLRNYLTPIRGRFELLEQRAQRDGREQDIRDVRTVNHTLGLLERMSADLLDVARLNQGIFAINDQPMHLMELVQEVVAAFRTAERPIHVHTPVEVVFSADPDRLRQLLENVLANAVKCAPKQTPIIVEGAIERRMDGPWMILTVSNAGPGLPAERLSTFFHPFAAGSPSASLGLYLANRIASAHGATLTIDSPAGQGVQVTLALPVEEEELIVHDQETHDPLT